MKNRIIKAALTLLGVLLMTCKTPEGSGNSLTVIKEISDFSMITIMGAKKVTLKQGEKNTIKITADDNIIKNIEVKIIDERLIVGPNKKMKDTDISVEITAPKITHAEINGNTKVEIPNGYNTHNLEFVLNGAVGIDCDNLISDGRIVINNNGSGSSTLGGKAETLVLKTKGSGTILAEKFTADSIGVKIDGSGSIYVKSDNYLNVKINGSGSVIYDGKPQKFEKRINGSGKIIQR